MAINNNGSNGDGDGDGHGSDVHVSGKQLSSRLTSMKFMQRGTKPATANFNKSTTTHNKAGDSVRINLETFSTNSQGEHTRSAIGASSNNADSSVAHMQVTVDTAAQSSTANIDDFATPIFQFPAHFLLHGRRSFGGFNKTIERTAALMRSENHVKDCHTGDACNSGSFNNRHGKRGSALATPISVNHKQKKRRKEQKDSFPDRGSVGIENKSSIYSSKNLEIAESNVFLKPRELL